MVYVKCFAFLLLCLGTVAQGNKDENVPCINQDVDVYLDKILDKASKEIPDPMRLPPKSTIVELKEGIVWGMSTLYRKGNAEVKCEDDGSVTISAKLGVDELKGRYTWEKEKSSTKVKTGYIVLIADDFESDIQISVPKSEEHAHPRLTLFKIKSLKDVRTEITGMGLVTWALSEIATMMSGIFQRAIARAVQGPLREALEREMREIEL